MIVDYCLRCTMTTEHDLQQLCYSGFSFFIQIPHDEDTED